MANWKTWTGIGVVSAGVALASLSDTVMNKVYALKENFSSGKEEAVATAPAIPEAAKPAEEKLPAGAKQSYELPGQATATFHAVTHRGVEYKLQFADMSNGTHNNGGALEEGRLIIKYDVDSNQPTAVISEVHKAVTPQTRTYDANGNHLADRGGQMQMRTLNGSDLAMKAGEDLAAYVTGAMADRVAFIRSPEFTRGLETIMTPSAQSLGAHVRGAINGQGGSTKATYQAKD